MFSILNKVMRKLNITFAIVILSIILCSCNLFFDKEEVRKKVLSQEPSFAKILEEKEKIDQKMGELKKSLSDKKNAYKAEVSALKDKFSQEKRKIDLEIQNLQNQLNNYMENIKVQIGDLSRRLRTRKRMLKNVNSTIKEANRLLNGDSDIKLSDEEKRRWQRRLSDLKLQRKELKESIKSLEKELDLEKTKLRLLQI